MKYLIVSDLHIGSHSVLPEEVSFEVLDWIYETAKELSIDKLIYTGDVFKSANPRDSVKTYFIKTILNYNISTRIIVGNHDYSSRRGFDYKSTISYPSSLDILNIIAQKASLDLKVFNSPFFDEEESILYLPYGEQYDIVEKIILAQRKNTHPDNDLIVIGHFPVKDTAYDTGMQCIKGISKIIFSDETICGYLGHFHNRQSFYSGMYIGSPYCQKKSEQPPKGILCVETEDNQVVSEEFIDNNFSPIFLDITIDIPNEKILCNNLIIRKKDELIKKVRNNVINLIFVSKDLNSYEEFITNNSMFIDKIKELSFTFTDRLIIDEISFKPKESGFEFDFMKSYIDYLQSLVEDMDEYNDVLTEIKGYYETEIS